MSPWCENVVGLIRFPIHRSSHRRCSIEKAVLKNFTIFTGKHLCWSIILIKLQAQRPATLLNKTPTRVFPCGYYEVFKNTYLEENMRIAALNSTCIT